MDTSYMPTQVRVTGSARAYVHFAVIRQSADLDMCKSWIFYLAYSVNPG